MPPSWLTPQSVMLTDKVGVVTGAGAGIGKGVAVALARFGSDVAVCDRDEKTLEETRAECAALGVHVIATCLDVRNSDGVASWFDDIGREFGRVDIVVNNAGGTFQALFEDT